MTNTPDAPLFFNLLREVPDPEVTPERAAMRRLAGDMRLVIERLVFTRAPLEVLQEAAEALESIAGALQNYPQGRLFDSFGESANSGDPHSFFDHSPVVGKANPLAPPLELWIEDEKVMGRVRFGSAYEGPPGHVHGGYIAASFDEVLGMTQSMSGAPGMTGTLTVRYRKPTPLYVELRFEAELDRVEGRKIFTSGRLYHDDVLTAEAEGIFISVDFSRLTRPSG